MELRSRTEGSGHSSGGFELLKKAWDPPKESLDPPKGALGLKNRALGPENGALEMKLRL